MARHRNGDLTEAEQTIFRSGLGKLIWVARIARTGAIYGASAATRTFSDGEMADSVIGNEDFSENEEKGISKKKKDSDRMPVYRKFLQTNRSNVNKANFLEKIRRRAHR